MADRKIKTKKTDRRADSSSQSRHMTESSPNPHNEARVIEMPLRPDQRKHTTENMGQSTSTVENRMNPSVALPIEVPREKGNDRLDDDSMFNRADPEARELSDPNPTAERPGREGGGDVSDRNKTKNRKTA